MGWDRVHSRGRLVGAGCGQEHRLGTFFWRYDLDPEFPLCVLEYETLGSEDPMHSHDYLEVALCLEGSGRFWFGQRSYDIRPGDIFLINNLEAHVAHAAPDSNLRLLLALFLPEFIAAPGCRPFDSAYLSPFLDSERFVPRIPHESQLAQELRPVLFDLKDAAQSSHLWDRYAIDATLRRFLSLVIKQRGQQEAPAELAAGDGQQHVQPALDYLATHFRETVTLERIAETMHVSTSRARHLFKEVTSVGFKEYVTKLRLAEARRLLLNSDANICDVASAVGYTNIHQFYKVFQRYTRMSPADYRRYYTLPSRPNPPEIGDGFGGDDGVFDQQRVAS
jgi:AraC-like DNA-binding protein/mannose-6-phosphate isomerase-like protein (cupin superfamily)